MACSVAAALTGIGLAYVFYVRSPELPGELARRLGAVYRLLLNKYWVDELYDTTVVRGTVALAGGLWTFLDATVIDGVVNGVGQLVAGQSALWRRAQTGNVQHYVLTFLAGVVVILGIMLMR
jgi:NADH-quinone oxidoreductase subunit L